MRARPADALLFRFPRSFSGGRSIWSMADFVLAFFFSRLCRWRSRREQGALDGLLVRCVAPSDCTRRRSLPCRAVLSSCPVGELALHVGLELVLVPSYVLASYFGFEIARVLGVVGCRGSESLLRIAAGVDSFRSCSFFLCRSWGLLEALARRICPASVLSSV